MITKAKPLYRLVTQDSRGVSESMEVTDNHPYWVRGKGWVDAANLDVGMELESLDHGKLTVMSLSTVGRSDITYNFTVADFHTYFAGKQKAFVHNCSQKCVGAGASSEVGMTLPGVSRPIRILNADFPANQGALDFMNSRRLRDMVLDTHCVDCSDIAPQLQRAAGGGGQILEVRPTIKNNLNVYENGSIEPGQSFHQVYTDGRYVYDPRVSLTPIPKGDWMQHIKNINPGGIIIKPKN
ncbi:HINT domain-containing protein [Massilia sp. P8910]|uniref:polymorphic toxin-type HINT domain-containing protein n=1 Tax=Massilia antarctica TaxID=2765360 RepID=UPI001E63584E|nr:polymorphic toxin-type HINT domain-containing protein [Massilia antarctica]MCE3602208.1 HINT domain-containing protein [Massilia antarctica]